MKKFCPGPALALSLLLVVILNSCQKEVAGSIEAPPHTDSGWFVSKVHAIESLLE